MGASFRAARAVFFDVDDTLYDFAASMEHAFAHLRQVYPDVLGQHEAERVSRAYWGFYHECPEDVKVHLINTDPDLYRRTMWAGALARLGCDADEAALAWLRKAHPDILRPFSDPDGFVCVLAKEFERARPEHWRAAMYDGARDLLRELKGTRTLGAITNGPSKVQRPKLEAFDYRAFFPERLVFVSGEFGARKPDPSIFLAAAEAAGVAPDECVMVGDAREFDMPAKAVGFRTVLFDGKKQKPDCSADPYPPDAVVASYAELRRLLF